MTNDLLENYLKPRMHRDSILNLLDPPYFEGVKKRLPKGLNVPDYLSKNDLNSDSVSEDKKDRDRQLWYILNLQSDTLMSYWVGQSMSYPKFSVIKFSSDSVAREFWVGEY